MRIKGACSKPDRYKSCIISEAEIRHVGQTSSDSALLRFIKSAILRAEKELQRHHLNSVITIKHLP